MVATSSTGFYAVAGLLLAMLAAGQAVAGGLRPRTEETGGRLEGLLATPLPRWRWWLAQTALTVLGPTLAVVAGGVGLGAGYALATGDGSRVGPLELATLVMLPGTLLLGAVALVLVSVAPRAAVAAWAYLALCAVVLLLARALRLPSWVVDLSPFSHLGTYPATAVPWGAVLLVTLLAAVLAGAATLAFTRRDLAA